MDHPNEQGPRTSKIEEGDIHAEDIERRDFLRVGVFAATGLVGLTMACGGDTSDVADQDTGDPSDADPTDPADADTGDPSDSD